MPLTYSPVPRYFFDVGQPVRSRFRRFEIQNMRTIHRRGNALAQFVFGRVFLNRSWQAASDGSGNFGCPGRTLFLITFSGFSGPRRRRVSPRSFPRARKSIESEITLAFEDPRAAAAVQPTAKASLQTAVLPHREFPLATRRCSIRHTPAPRSTRHPSPILLGDEKWWSYQPCCCLQ